MFGFAAFSEVPFSTQKQPLEENTLVLPLIASSNVLYAPTVIREELLVLPLLTNANQFYAMALGLEATLPFLTNTSVLYPPSAAVEITLPLITDGDTLYAPTVASFTIRLSFISEGNVLYPPSSSLTPATLILPLLANQNIFYQHAVRGQNFIFTGVSYILE